LGRPSSATCSRRGEHGGEVAPRRVAAWEARRGRRGAAPEGGGSGQVPHLGAVDCCPEGVRRGRPVCGRLGKTRTRPRHERSRRNTSTALGVGGDGDGGLDPRLGTKLAHTGGAALAGRARAPAPE